MEEKEEEASPREMGHLGKQEGWTPIKKESCLGQSGSCGQQPEDAASGQDETAQRDRLQAAQVSCRGDREGSVDAPSRVCQRMEGNRTGAWGWQGTGEGQGCGLAMLTRQRQQARGPARRHGGQVTPGTDDVVPMMRLEQKLGGPARCSPPCRPPVQGAPLRPRLPA